MVGQETFTNHPTTQPPTHLTAFGSRGFGWEITSLNRYYPWKGQVVIDNEATTRLEAQLVKHAVLIISVHPASAMVSMDGGPEQAAPPRLSGIPLGKHTLTAHAPDFERQTVEVTLRAGEEKRLSVTLNRARVALLVHSAPEGADVALDGEVKGKTPLQMAEVLTGEHTLRLSLDGYETIERSLTVHESPEPIALTLKPSIGRIQINSTPAGASIHLKGEIMGLTPHTLELRPGEQTLELRLTAYRTALQTIQLQPGTNPPVTVQLERQRGTLRITSTPAEATIALNGERRDERTPAEFVLPPGEYTVAIEHENYEPYTETVTLADQAVQPIEATLPHQTQLRVTSDPAGIDVDLGALGRHKTMHQAAVLLRDVSPGTYEATAKVKGYQPLKQRFEVTPHQYNTLAIQLSPKSRLDMAGSSLLLPGSGQYYGERYVSGTFFLLMEVGAIVSAIVAYQEYDQALVRYHRAEEQYRNAVMLSEIQDARQKLVKAHDAAERKLVFQQAAFGAIGGVWALNVLHAMIAGPAGLRHESDLASKYGEVSLEWVRYPGSNDYVFGGIGFLPLRITNQSRSIGKIGISCAIGLDRGSIEDTLEQLSDETIRRLGPSGQIAISAFFFNNPRQPIVPFLRGIARIPNEVIRGKGGDIRFGFEGGLYLLYRQTVALQFGLNVSDTRDIQRSGGPVGIRFGLSLLP
ncbi:PEGA domain-containing protein [Candidatus Poribacteria bacterium]|nr:PEGA domain-containing protein [Candidatus Poribacteria bacterium]